nr:RES family NAD+ phosphorylase [Sneathiella chinensis]
MAPLVDTGDDLAFLEEFERLTSGRQNEVIPLPSGVHKTELLTEAHGYGYSYVNAAFCYTRTTGNRFNGPERGAWYAAHGKDALETAKAEVAFHLGRELHNTGIYENITAYRELIAGFTGQFHTLQKAGAHPALTPDPAVGYPAGQHLAASLRAEGASGLLYPSIRRKGGRCLVAFRTNLVQNIRQGDGWRFEWDGSPTPVIETF